MENQAIIYEWIDKTPCVSLQGLLDAGVEWITPNQRKDGRITFPLWDKWMTKARKAGHIVRRAALNRSSLIAWSAIPDKYRYYIIRDFGKPSQDNSEVKWLLDNFILDTEAEKFYNEYLLDDGRSLPDDHKERYTNNASVLNLIRKHFEARELFLKKTGKKFRPPWADMSRKVNLAQKELNHSLPSHPKSLRVTYSTYVQTGFESLISGKWCNDNSEKITPEIEQWFVNEMANTRQSADMVYLRYANEAEKRGWDKNITRAAFVARSREPRVQQLIFKLRHGERAFRQKYGQTFRIEKPTFSNDVWVGDGTQLSWYYRSTEVDKKGHQRTVLKTCTTYAVLDVTSNKFLGWDTAEGINKENFRMQLNGYRMAVRNANAKPYQLLHDNQGGHKKTEGKAFYSKLAKVTFPTRAYRPTGKAVEQAFGKFQLMFLSELPFWTGFNRASHSNQNYAPDYNILQQNIDKLPSYEEVVELAAVFFEKWNSYKPENGQSPNEIYESKRNLEEKPISLDELAELFFDIQGPKKYYATGIKLRIDGEDKLYEVYKDGDVDYNFRREHLHERFYLKYDPEQLIDIVELYQMHGTGGLQKIASAEPKRGVNRSVKYLNDDDKAWIDKQMKLEGEMFEEMDQEAQELGYNEVEKFSRWREYLEPKPSFAEASEDEDDIEKLMINRI